MNKLIGLLGSALLFCASQAMATTCFVANGSCSTSDLGALDPDSYSFSRTYETKNSGVPDEWRFTLSDAANISALQFSTTSPTSLLKDLNFTLHFTGASGFLASAGNAVAGCSAILSPSQCAAGLQAGNYVIAFNATEPGAQTASRNYAGSFTLSAVPLPPAAILFGSVLFGFAVVARKRNLGAALSG